MITAITTAVVIGMTLLNIKMQEYEMQKQTNRLKLEEQKIELQNQKTSKLDGLNEIKKKKNQLLINKAKREQLKLNLQNAIAEATANNDTVKATKLQAQLNGMIAKDAEYEASFQKEMNTLNAEELQLKAEIKQIDMDCATLTMQQAQNGAGLLSILTSITPVLSFIISLMQM
jgi:imidazoleglycerol phosphate synthase glutamine amidotransferase subunit HisH